ncbi:MAG: sigma-70 family RNA polymerase sigma factor [Desulfitobacteriia bacterium]
MDEVEYLCDQLLTMGVIISGDTAEKPDNDDEVYDRGRIDYEKLFQEITKRDESLALFMKEISRIKPPQHREFQNLLPQAKNGNLYAKQRIIEMYLRFVVRIAFWHHEKYKLPLADTIQDGCVGLIIALDKYEPGKHGNFLTYAPWWVRQVIMREAPTKNPLFYFPVYIKDRLFSIYDVLGYNACDLFEWDEIDTGIIEAVAEKLNCSIDEAKECLGYLRQFESIDEILSMDNDNCFDDRGEAQDKMLDDCYLKEEARATLEMLKTFKLRDQKIILMRSGYLDGNEWTLQEVGMELGLTRERVRQIEGKTIRKLQELRESLLFKSLILSGYQKSR